jgi:hypothetical protein
MGLNNDAGSSTTFLNVADGKLIRRHQQPNERTVERITKTGKQVFEESFRDLKALLVEVKTYENDYGKQWHLVFKENEDTYIVTMPYSSRYASSFLKALPNVDLSKEVRFMPWSMVDKNDSSRKITGVTMYQSEGGKIPPRYTKEEPNGLPEMKQIKVKGKITWDDSDMMDFLEKEASLLFTEKPPF